MGDKYSSYIEPTKATDFKKDLEGEFEGIGAYVDMVQDKFYITAPIKGSPAEKAGLLPGDQVTQVDHHPILGQTQAEIVEQVKGPEGTTVLLTIARKNEPEKEIEVVRGKIEVPSVTLEWNQSVPIIGIHQFNQETKKRFHDILTKEVLPKKPRGLVLDFRNNPGGYLTAAVEIGEYFLDEGDLIFSVEYKDRFREYASRRKGELYGMNNIVLLQNKGTASASEIIIAMMQDYDIGKVIGSQSLGKGTVQEISNFSNGGLLKLTIAKWLTPLGNWVHEEGITPDILVEDPTPEDRVNQTDMPLERAVREILEQ
jgi:carboxyl-terminal processing protease